MPLPWCSRRANPPLPAERRWSAHGSASQRKKERVLGKDPGTRFLRLTGLPITRLELQVPLQVELGDGELESTSARLFSMSFLGIPAPRASLRNPLFVAT